MRFNLLLLLGVTAHVVHASSDLCCLCGGCEFPVRPNYKVNSAGTTCAGIDLQMGNPFQTPKGSSKCTSMYNAYNKMCCNASYNPPTVVQQTSTVTTQSIAKTGPYNVCNICKDNSKPR